MLVDRKDIETLNTVIGRLESELRTCKTARDRAKVQALLENARSLRGHLLELAGETLPN